MIILEHNVETGEVIEREATSQEIAQVELEDSISAAAREAAEAKAAAKIALLERLGITEAEAQLLLA